MKKKIALVALCLAAASGLHAADLILETNTSSAQNQAQLQLRLAGKQEAVAGIQFDLEYDDALVKVEILAGPAATLAEKTVQSASPAPGRLRVLLVGFNQTVITNGVVALVRVSSKDASGAPRSAKVRLVSPAATDRAGVVLELVAKGDEQVVQTTGNPKN